MLRVNATMTAALVLVAVEFAGTLVTAQNLSYPAPGQFDRLADTLSLAGRSQAKISDATLKLESKAYNWSKYSTLAPIVAGVVVWKLQKPKHLVDYDSYGNVVWDRYEDPDRMLPILLVCGGVIVGPSVGYFVGDCPNRGIAGILIRGGVAGLTLVAATAAANSVESDGFMNFGHQIAVGVMVGTVGSLVVLALAGNDFAHIKEVVRRAHEKKLRGTIRLSPRMLDSGRVLGVGLNVTL